jgi:hypothetical protein
MVYAEIILEVIFESGCLQSIKNMIWLHVLKIAHFIHVTGRIRTGRSWDRSFQFFLFFSFSLWLYSPLDLGRFCSFLILYTVGRTPQTGDQSVARPLPEHRINAHRHPFLEWESNKRHHCSSRWRRFKALDSSAAVIGPVSLGTLMQNVNWLRLIQSWTK